MYVGDIKSIQEHNIMVTSRLQCIPIWNMAVFCSGVLQWCTNECFVKTVSTVQLHCLHKIHNTLL